MNAAKILQAVFPSVTIPKRRSEKVKLNIIKKSVMKRGQSLIHRSVFESLPVNKGIWWKAFSAFPASYQTNAGKRMQEIVIQELKSDPKTREINRKIGDSSLLVLILYKLLSKRKRDIDNYTKNVIDALKKGGLFKDDNHNQVKFLASKVDVIPIKDHVYPSSLEKTIVYVDYFNDENPLVKEFSSIFRS